MKHLMALFVLIVFASFVSCSDSGTTVQVGDEQDGPSTATLFEYTEEVEPNDSVHSAMSLSVDCVCTGFSVTADDVDWFKISGVSSQLTRVSVEATTEGDLLKVDLYRNVAEAGVTPDLKFHSHYSTQGNYSEAFVVLDSTVDEIFMRVRSYSLSSEDEGYAASYDMTIECEEAQPADGPSLSVSSNPNGLEGELHTLTVAAFGEPDASFAYTVEGGPDELTITPAGDTRSCDITWTPGFEESGAHVWLVGVTDTNGVHSEGAWLEVAVTIYENRFVAVTDLDPSTPETSWTAFARNLNDLNQPGIYVTRAEENDPPIDLTMALDWIELDSSLATLTLQRRLTPKTLNDATGWTDWRVLTVAEVSAKSVDFDHDYGMYDYRVKAEIDPLDPAHAELGDEQLSNPVTVLTAETEVEEDVIGISRGDKVDDTRQVPATSETNPVKIWPGEKLYIEDYSTPLPDWPKDAPSMSMFWGEWTFQIAKVNEEGEIGTWEDAETSPEPPDPKDKDKRDVKKPKGHVCLPKEPGTYCVRICCDLKGFLGPGAAWGGLDDSDGDGEGDGEEEPADDCPDDESGASGTTDGPIYGKPICVSIPCVGIAGDVDGDGDIDEDDMEAEKEGECARVLPNCDRDQDLPDDKPDSEDDEVGGNGDDDDLSEFEVKLDCPLPAGWSVKIEQTVGSTRSNIFPNRTPGSKIAPASKTSAADNPVWKFDDQLNFVPEDPNNPPPANATPSGDNIAHTITMAIEMTKPMQKVPCTLKIDNEGDPYFEVDAEEHKARNAVVLKMSICDKDEKEVFCAKTTLWAAPFRANSNDDNGRNVQISDDSDADSTETGLTNSGCATVEAISGGDRWLQDIVQYGSFEGSNSSMNAAMILPRERRGQNAQNTANNLRASARGRNSYVQETTDIDISSTGLSSLLSGGNLESVCSFEGGGLTLYGSPTDDFDTGNLGNHSRVVDFECLLAANTIENFKPDDLGKLQTESLCMLDTGWLDVGHIDEILTARTDSTGKCVIFVGDTQMALDLLGEKDQFGNPIYDWDKKLFDSPGNPHLGTVKLKDLVTPGEFLNDQQLKAQSFIDRNVAHLKRCLDARNFSYQIQKIPALYWRKPSDRPNAPLTRDFLTMDALSPNVLWTDDCVFIGKSRIKVYNAAGQAQPNPLTAKYKELLKVGVAGQLESNIHELEIWDAYHDEHGGCHCATNSPN